MFRAFKQMRKLNRSSLSEDEWYDTDANGRGIIDVGAENYDDIFSYYDLDGVGVLDREFDEFLEVKVDVIPLKKEIALHFHVKNPSEEKRDEIDRTIKNHYKRELKALNRKLHRVNMFALYMFVMGLLFLGIYIPLTIFEVYFVIPYICDIASWVFFWEAVDQWFLHRREIKHEMLKKYRFIRSDISIKEYKQKKKKQIKYGNNSKTLNKMLNVANKEVKSANAKISKLEQTKSEN